MSDPEFDKTFKENAAKRKRESRERKKLEAKKENNKPVDEENIEHSKSIEPSNSTLDEGRNKAKKGLFPILLLQNT